MTGFGDASCTASGRELNVTLRAVNHRQLDVRVALPAEVGTLEPKVTALIKSELKRGRVDVRISAPDRAKNSSQSWDSAVARVKELATEHELGEISVSDVLRFSQVTRPEERTRLDGDEVLACVAEALAALQTFRRREGGVLRTLFEEHTARLSALLEGIEADAGEGIARHRDRITSRVTELLGEKHELDKGRIEQEVVLLAERSDIAEEIVRAREHLRALSELVAEGRTVAKGKQLDFLLQELIRETNTMASKSVSSAVTHRVVEAKSLIEQLREQALNVE
jgi:uncharacterized protein (TIGR00255 family)